VIVVKILAVIAGGLMLSGCVIMTPSPAMEALELIGALTVKTVSLGPYKPDHEVTHAHNKIQNVCIEFNAESAVADFVPSLQAILAKSSVDSRVYRFGEIPSGCRHSLHYTAYQRWEKQLLGSEYTPYLIAAQLILRENGKVVASAGYELGVLGLDVRASTRRKIAPAVTAILVETPRQSDK